MLGEQAIDAGILAAVKKTENLARYLKTSFGLSKGDRAHELSVPPPLIPLRIVPGTEVRSCCRSVF